MPWEGVIPTLIKPAFHMGRRLFLAFTASAKGIFFVILQPLRAMHTNPPPTAARTEWEVNSVPTAFANRKQFSG